MLGEYDVAAYLLMWGLYVVPLVLFSSALGVLVRASVRERMRPPL